MEPVGAVSSCQWCCAPLQLIKLGNQAIRLGGMLLPLLMRCPRLVWRAVAVIAVWSHMIAGHIGEFLLRPEFIQIGAFVLQGVEVPLHWRIIVWVSGFAHALGHMGRPAELYESL